MERMTWIKPSFCWMAMRCGYGQKKNQQVVLAIDMDRAGFEWALANATLSSHDGSKPHGRCKDSPVVVQWDPERDAVGTKLAHRAIQIGMRGDAVKRYLVAIRRITDVTPLMRTVEAAVRASGPDGAVGLLPHERVYPLPPTICRVLGMEPLARS